MYDQNGNLTSWNGKSLHYNHNNQLVEVKYTEGGFDWDWWFRYGVLGRRMTESFSDGLVHQRKFWYDGQMVIYEEADGVKYRYYNGNLIDEVLCREDNFGSQIWYLTDALGSVYVLTDNSGNVVEAYHYSIYGEPKVYAPDGTPRDLTNYDNRLLFTSREYIWQLHLYYYRARWMVPQLGVFCSRDVFMNKRTASPYTYAGGIPVVYVDPSGFKCRSPNFYSEPRYYSFLQTVLYIVHTLPMTPPMPPEMVLIPLNLPVVVAIAVPLHLNLCYCFHCWHKDFLNADYKPLLEWLIETARPVTWLGRKRFAYFGDARFWAYELNKIVAASILAQIAKEESQNDPSARGRAKGQASTPLAKLDDFFTYPLGLFQLRDAAFAEAKRIDARVDISSPYMRCNPVNNARAALAYVARIACIPRWKVYLKEALQHRQGWETAQRLWHRIVQNAKRSVRQLVQRRFTDPDHPTLTDYLRELWRKGGPPVIGPVGVQF